LVSRLHELASRLRRDLVPPRSNDMSSRNWLPCGWMRPRTITGVVGFDSSAR
jgi:hypothetical protein